MLERAALVIGPWRQLPPGSLPGWDAAGWGRSIADARATPLGFVRAVRLAPWSWLIPQRFDVCETEDASLLMTLEQPWLSFGRFRVLDSESRLVGSVLVPHVLDSDGARLARIERNGSGNQQVRMTAGEIAATLAVQDGGALLSFPADTEPNPFLRMLMLGAALALEPRPG